MDPVELISYSFYAYSTIIAIIINIESDRMDIKTSYPNKTGQFYYMWIIDLSKTSFQNVHSFHSVCLNTRFLLQKKN